MEQLKLGLYSRAEMAEILNLDIKDTRHFKRNVENKLAKWGYGVIVNRKNIEITKIPTTAEEKLAEIFIRGFDLDIQTEIYSMACFIIMLLEYEDFQSMPWDVRVEELRREYGVSVASSTLKKWNAKLISKNLIAKCNYDKTAWITYYVEGEKFREMITGNEDYERDMRNYYQRRRDLVEDYKDRAYTAGRDDFEKINSEAWSYAFKTLWEEKHCCYYYCCSFYLNAIGEYAQEIYELVDEISARKKPYNPSPSAFGAVAQEVKEGEFHF